MEFTEYSSDEIRKVASFLSGTYGSFNIVGNDLTFTNNLDLKKEDIQGSFLTIIKGFVIDEINSKAERARANILTPGDGQKIAYAYKFLEALEIAKLPAEAKLNPDDYIMLSAELQSHGKVLSLREMAKYVLDRVLFSKKAFSLIEVTRFTAHEQVTKAKTKEEAYQVLKDTTFVIPENLK